ncbi:MAG: signal peptidase II [Eubacteriales bacterium]|nr:signal peptidase II [Eubacteriales bacterium]
MKRYVRAFVSCALLVLVDQLSKLWAVQTLKDGNPIPVIRGVLEFLYVENRGAAFGIMQGRQWLFLIISLAVVLGLVYLLPRIPGERRYLWLRLCLYLVAAGAVGNMIDRLFRGYVVDFFYFKLIDFPVFNVADIYVTGSAFCLMLLVLFYYKEEDFDRVFPRKK